MWFEKLMGFREESPEQVRRNIRLQDEVLTSLVNGRSYRCGRLEIPTLGALRDLYPDLKSHTGRLQVAEIVADVQKLHLDPANRNALFQAASQFNLLEMVSPMVIPEMGVGIYEEDHTQGPACAIACGAGTIYRNYFAEVNGQTGQSMDDQIDCLDLVGEHLDNYMSGLWEMRNGYALLHSPGIRDINEQLGKMTTDEREDLKGKLKIGLQWDAEVTLAGDREQIVHQAYCSALPVSYSDVDDPSECEAFARLILEASYEATLHCALRNLSQRNCPKVYLTLVGGGVFGNQIDWIMDALFVALQPFLHTPLQVMIVSYGHSRPEIGKLIYRIG